MAPANDNSANDNALTDFDIALLCDIGSYSPDENEPEKKSQVERLLAGGYVECSHADMAAAGAKFMLTGKAEKILADRGVGLNES
jgi:hypothetical protein